MAINTIRDLEETPSNNVDFLGSDASGSGNASAIDTVRQNLGAIIARGYGDMGARGTVGGSANAITVTSLSTYQVLEAGIQIAFKASAANTGATTLNLDNNGAKAIRLKGDTALSAGHIAANGIYDLVYDEAYNSANGAWVLLNPEIPAGTYVQFDGSGNLAMADKEVQRPVLVDYGEKVNALGSGGGARDIDLTLGNVVTATVSSSTNTFTFSNPSASGTACSFTLILTNGGSQTVNWPASVDWPDATAPTLTTSGVDVLGFLTTNGGTTWYGFPGGLGMG